VSPLVFGLVLLAAGLHAGWNALIKINDDRLVAMAILAGSTALISVGMLPFVPLPAPAAWPYLLVTSFIHLGYMGFLVLAYAKGDFGQVYPIARGAAPLMTAIIGLVVLGEHLSIVQWTAIVLITGGIISLAIHGIGSITHNLKSVGYAFATAAFIAVYTVVDATGARLSGNVHSFALWLFFLHGFPLFALTAWRRGSDLWPSVQANWKGAALGGAMSLVAYWIVLWAMTVGTVAPVAALRETSVIFATVIAALFFKEGFGWQRVMAAAVVAFGAYLLATSG